MVVKRPELKAKLAIILKHLTNIELKTPVKDLTIQ